MSKEAMKLALEAFSVIAIADNLDWIRHQAEQQAAALREALVEQPAPTNCRHCGGADNVICAGQCKAQPAQHQPLTHEEITAISKQVAEGGPNDSIDRFVRAIEAAHGIKENT